MKVQQGPAFGAPVIVVVLGTGCSNLDNRFSYPSLSVPVLRS